MQLTADHLTIRSKDLPGEVSNARLWMILKQFPTNEAEYHHASWQALCWYYRTVYGCSYSGAVERRLDLLDPSPNQAGS